MSQLPSTSQTIMHNIKREEKELCIENSVHTEGFRFHPTDTELVKYLLQYVLKGRLPELIPIEEEDLYSKEPWVVFKDRKERTLYFFTELKKKKIENSRFIRSVGKGSWKSQDKGKPVCSEKGSVMGYKRSLRYQNSGSPQDGQWLMKEYSLTDEVKKILHQRSRGYDKDNYVLCRVKRKVAKDDPIARKESIEAAELEAIMNPTDGSTKFPNLSIDDVAKLKMRMQFASGK
ncbi:NAC domain-containing protein 96-like [Nicotiana tabacum]|uniref:NAC domain-containing protein 78-like n=1 Tax=Nicotiana tabacum TaxID=4097 RepID=A0A1S4ABN4_TOBAC|nr:NAC domain-containing protein 96-like [Nicotiana tomentosiformis]XP_016474024.1 PREDICTED: NAC domain-containing protein 78-like [Nicotiana tabacum]